MLVAFSRPDVHDRFPELVKALPMHEIVLGGLTRRPAEQLVGIALGEGVPKHLVARIVRQAGGNAFYLEELIRAVAEGRATELPDSVVAMAQARLDGVSSEARRVLRAASIFGEVFSESSVAALLGGALTRDEVAEWIRTLIDLELLSPSGEGSGGEEGRTYGFRHALLREAAYESLTEADRQNGHRLAAEWLARTGEKNALVVAEHFERGGQPVRGLPWRHQAAEMALNAGNNDLAHSIAAHGLPAAEGDVRGRLLELQQTALLFRGDFAQSFAVAEAAMAELPWGSRPWVRSAASRLVSAIYLGRPSAVLDILRASTGAPVARPTGPFGLAVQMLVSALLHAGARGLVAQFFQSIEGAGANESEPDPVFTGWRHTTNATLALFMHDRIAPAIAHGADALAAFESAADFMGRSVASLYYGIAHVEAGDFASARQILEQVASSTEKMLLPSVDFARYYLARIDALSGATARAESLLASPPGIADGARGFLAEARLQSGDLDGAEREARAIQASASCYARVTGLSVIGRVAMARHRYEEALGIIDAAIRAQDEGSGVPFWRSTLLLARSEVLMKVGDRDAARASIQAAAARISRIAGEFGNVELAASYSSLEMHRRTLELAREWSGEEP
jgi:tetratricopeptide (TPR) repeat protein